MAANFDAIKAKLIEQYEAFVPDEVRRNLIRQTLMPCIGADASTDQQPSLGRSKFGGFPDLPEGFVLPDSNGIPLIFLGQLNFAEIQAFDVEGRLPKEGILSFFAMLWDGEQGVVPDQKNDLKAYYFEPGIVLKPMEAPQVRMKELKEVFLDFHLYADIPEFGDYRLPDEYLEIDPDFKFNWEIIPQAFTGEQPSVKILGYPTDDAANSYLEWYCFERECSFENNPEFLEAMKREMQEYELLFWASLESLGAMVIEDEYISFGGISIGIRREDLAQGNFDSLFFKYSIS